MHGRLLVLVAVAILATTATAASAASAPDRGVAFNPHPLSQPLYGTKAPSADPATQQHWVTAHDGVQIYVETWLPAAKDGNVPPANVPTILVATPYVLQGKQRYAALEPNDLVPYFTARGYAVAQENIRGTGESGGCLEQTSTDQIDDTARVIEYLGRDAKWADGNVGMYGKSYDGETQVSTAGLGGAARTKYLKAIVPIESVGGQYEYSNMDGVPFAGQAALSDGTYLALTSATPGTTTPTQPKQMGEKLTCLPDVAVMAADPTGDLNSSWQPREYRPAAKNITAATLWVHGFDDFNVLPVTIAGFFDRLPATTPHVGMFGQWQHEYPDNHPATEPAWNRPDFFPMVTAWYDRYLKGLDTGVESWPRVQIQDNLGQWRTEPNFPYNAGAPTGQLALGAGKLGDSAPTGSDTYVAGKDTLTYDTAAVSAPLHVTGVPIADLWLTTSLPTGQVVATLSAIGPSGAALPHSITHGARSLRHLDPMPDGYFVQQHGGVPPVSTAIRVPVKFLPTDLVVPAGGKLRLTLAGTGGVRTILPSGLGAQVGILHDCTHPSALRFEMPRADSPLLNVRETDEAGKTLTSTDETAGVQDGGGAAGAPFCGHGPFDPQGILTGELVSSYEGPAAQ